MKSEIINSGTKINRAELRDVNNLLLKHFLENWKDLSNLEFYKQIILILINRCYNTIHVKVWS